MLNQENDMIERMELDLCTKAAAAYIAAGLEAGVHGVFNIDDLELKTGSELCGKLAVGVGYAGAETASPTPNSQNPGGGNAARMVGYLFHVILAVPHGADCVERYSGTKLLTVLRRSINGKSCDGDTASRTWTFVKEFPNVAESTDSMLYYSQVWRIAIPLVG